jgi:excisionase family DNA binding protein
MEVVVATPISGPSLTPSAFRPEWPPRARTLTPRRIAERLQVSEREVFRWLRGGDLRGLRIDNEWRVSERQLGAFLEERANISVLRHLIRLHGL